MNLSQIFNPDTKFTTDMKFNIDMKSMMEYDNTTQLVFVEKPVAYTLNTPMLQATEFKYGTTSSLLSK